MYIRLLFGQGSEFLNVLLVRRTLRAAGCKTGPIFLHYEDACSICCASVQKCLSVAEHDKSAACSRDD